MYFELENFKKNCDHLYLDIYIYIYIKSKLRKNLIRIQIEFQLESNFMPSVQLNFLNFDEPQ